MIALLRIASLILSFVFAASAVAQTTVTLQDGLNGYTGVQDNGIGDETNDGANWLYGMNWSTQAIAIRFDKIFQSEGGPVPNGATITSATLSLNQFEGPESTFEARRLLKNWRELEATWSLAASGLPWQTPGAKGQADVAAAADGQSTTSAAPVWLNLDVTSGVRAFAAGTPNYGWRVGWVTGTTGAKMFYSAQAYQDPTLRPKLTIAYTTGPVCTTVPTAQFTATPASGKAPLTVQFNASASTDGSSPITSLRLQFGDAQEVSWTSKTQTQSHPYTVAATYTATLTATNSCGTSAPVTRTITVTTGPTVPTAQLTASPSSGTGSSLDVTFSASGSTDGGSPITGLRLQFGDNTQDATWTDKNVPQQHPYPARSTPYTATLTVTNAVGTSAPVTRTITVAPQAACSGDNVPTASNPAGALGTAMPTFHSMSVYYKPPTAPSNETVWMRYRRACETTWREGWRLWFDPRTGPSAVSLPYAFPARGSAVYLEPDTKYYFELGIGATFADAAWLHYVTGTTWSETIPEATGVTPIPTQSDPYVISVGGTPSAYKVYDGWNSATNSKNVIDRHGAGLTDGPAHDAIVEAYLTGAGTPKWADTSFAIVIKASNVIVRRVIAKGAAAAGIVVYPNVTNVVIEDTEVSDWSWRPGTPFSGHPQPQPGWGTWGMNEAGGIHLSGNNSHIVLQRNIIRDPHFGSTPWDFSHAIGPNGVTVYSGGQQNVIRYNEVYATGPDEMHWFLDGIGGGDNFSAIGSPGPDSDIYQNNVQNAMDDAIEAEGGGRNVRVWGNYIDHSGSGIATTVAHLGPLYAFRNVFNRLKWYHASGRTTPDGDGWDRGAAFKAYGMGQDSGYGGGRRYFLHNTLLQQPGSTYSPQQTLDLGAGAGPVAADSFNQGVLNTWTSNNLFHTFRSAAPSIIVAAGGGRNNFDYDLYSCCLENDLHVAFTEPNGVRGVPSYKTGHGWMAFPRLSSAPNRDAVFGPGLGVGVGNFQLGTGSLGLNTGLPLPNFTYDIDNLALARKSGVEVSGNPDMGAHDSASAETMKFGVSAAQ